MRLILAALALLFLGCAQEVDVASTSELGSDRLEVTETIRESCTEGSDAFLASLLSIFEDARLEGCSKREAFNTGFLSCSNEVSTAEGEAECFACMTAIANQIYAD